MGFCKWCGNNPPSSEDGACSVCRPRISDNGDLAPAKEVFDLIASHYGVCCQGIITKTDSRKRFPDASLLQEILGTNKGLMKAMLASPIYDFVNVSHLFIHPKGGESSTANTTVECGVSLYHGHARCYWIFDSDRAAYCDSHEYGPEIPYSLGEEMFMKVVSVVLDKAATAAENQGVLSCKHCGDHYHEESPCDCQTAEAMLDEDVMNPYGDDPFNSNL